MSPEELRQNASDHVKIFLERSGSFPVPVVELRFHPERRLLPSCLSGAALESLFSSRNRDALFLHLVEEELLSIPSSVLQGWLDREVGFFLLEQEDGFGTVHFRNEILPLFPVSGSAVQLMRHLVEFLINAVKEHWVTELAVQVGHGLPQAHYRFFKDSGERGDSETYKRLMSHTWSRALFLSRKLKDLAPLCPLKRMHGSFPVGLHEEWWRRHGYLAERDRLLLEEMTSQCKYKGPGPFSRNVVDLFEIICRSLLR